MEPLEFTRRLRRNRKSGAIRALVQETRLHPNNLVAILFIEEGVGIKSEIPSMPGVFRYSIDLAVKEAKELWNLGIKAVDIFIKVEDAKKDPFGSEAIKEDNLMQQAVRALKKNVPDMCVMVDIALDPFTDHGHDGIVDDKGEILNDDTVRTLAKMSLLAAEAGVDMVAPSDMMDGRVGVIRQVLDQNGYTNVSILSYAAKYASAFYGPFRDALGSAPKFGDKSTYQLNPANSREARLECMLDEWEGADILMIKPALAYLDIVAKIREQTDLPLAAYHVSGEYAMVKAASQNGWINGEKVMLESLLSIKRAGADLIFTYAAKEVALFLQNNP